jgi:Protein of unknown function (DUF2946)
MPPTSRLRHCIRFVLVWFALSLTVAVASPLVNPQAMELICSGSGAMKVVVKGDDGSSTVVSHTLDCPLCASLSAPPPVAATLPEPPSPLSHVLRPIPAAHIAWLTAAPLPARGPPNFS